MMSARILVGTSGWHYDHWKGPFYPQDIRGEDMLGFAAKQFSTVEVNNSFYHLPSKKMFRAWSKQTPPDFTFSVKASRYITHMKKLNNSGQPVEKFLSSAGQLKKKLGPILFQLPPHWQRNAGRMKEFLAALPKKHRYAFEFRDPSWFHGEIFALMEKHNASLCSFDIAGQQSMHKLTADFAYMRLHGPSGQKYAGRYTRSQLRIWQRHAEQFLDEGAKQVFIYFDNDQLGYAALNALEIQKMIRSHPFHKSRPQRRA